MFSVKTWIGAKTNRCQTLDISNASEDLYFSLAEHNAFWARKRDRSKKRGRPRNRETDREKASESRRLRGMTIILYINQILYLLFTTAYTGHRIWSNLIYLRALRAQTRINGLLVLFFDWRGIWRQDKQLVQRWCLIFARRQKRVWN